LLMLPEYGKGARMEQEHIDAIEEIIGQSKCPKDFLCYGSGFETLCKARLIDGVPFLECIEKVPQLCALSLDFGSTHSCECPVRLYIAKELKK
jgi:hypothetical protein